MFVVSATATASASPICNAWFRRQKIDPKAINCFVQCCTAPVGLKDYACTSECGDLCENIPKVWIYFSNGMFNSLNEAEIASWELEAKVLPEVLRYDDLRPLPANGGRILLSYNLSERPIEQVLQVVEQKARSESVRFFQWLSKLGEAPAWFRNAVLESAKVIDKDTFVTDADLRVHVLEYASHIRANESVLVVAHSQGNFYSHAAYRLMMNEFGYNVKMRLVPVASPEFDETHEDLVNGWPYSNLASDCVINSIPSRLPANVANSKPGFCDHEFVTHYLEGDRSGKKIVSDVTCVVSRFLPEVPSIEALMGQVRPHPACKNLIEYPGSAEEDEEASLAE